MNNLHLRDGKIAFRWKRWRNKKRQEVSYCLMVLFSGAVLFGAGGMAAAGPTGGQVTGGTGTISQTGTTTTIDQTSNVLNINWQTFSTAPNETVNFVQPGSTSLAINRVVGGVPSYLQGALNANGRVFILNSAGITFAGTSRVNVGALLATTAMSIDGNVSGLSSFSAPSGSGGSVINQGSITVSNGGFAILAAPYVQNTGFIQANLGTVALAGTNQFTLDLSGNGLINFVVPPGAVQEIVQDGQKVGVDNSGTLQARSGQVIISANVASQVVNAVVNMTGVVDADALTANSAGGSVLVTSTGDINLGGTITAQGNGTGAGGQIVTKAAGADNVESGANLLAQGGSQGKGGFIEVSGQTVALNGNMHAGKGGRVLIDPGTLSIDTAQEAAIEASLQGGVNYTFSGDRIHFLKAAGGTDTLVGGSGDLKLTAVDSITFAAKDQVIRTGSGDITMTVTDGNIGDATHRLSVISSVNQAGNVILKAGQDIFLQDVTVKSKAGTHALFSAHAGANPGDSINVFGAIDVEAHDAGFNAHASALVNLHAHSIDIAGPVTVIANALNGSSILHSIDANAHLFAIADILGGAVTFGNTITVEAHANAINAVNGVDAVAEAVLNGQHVDVVGNVHVTATASFNGAADPSFVIASANLIVHAAPEMDITSVGSAIFDRINSGAAGEAYNGAIIDFQNAIDVEAHAIAASGLVNQVTAEAEVLLDAAHITVGGPADVVANASAASVNHISADARLVAQLGESKFTSTGTIGDFNYAFFGTAHVGANDVTFGNTITVNAVAVGDADNATATALAHIAGIQVDVAGKIIVDANASNDGGSANAKAKLLVDYADVDLTFAGHNASSIGTTLDDILASLNGALPPELNYALLAVANAFEVAGSETAVLHARAHIGGSNMQLLGGFSINADADATDGAAHAKALGTVAGVFINIGGNADVTANAHGSYASQVIADARLVTDLVGLDASVSFGYGNEAANHASFVAHRGSSFEVNGSAPTIALNAHFGGGSFFGTNLFAGEARFLGTVLVAAGASGHDVGTVGARASAHFVTFDLDMFGPVKVTATASGYDAGEIGAFARLLVDDADVALAVTNHQGMGVWDETSYSTGLRIGGSDVSFQKGFDVEAHANGAYAGYVGAVAEASLVAASHSNGTGGFSGGRIYVNGPVDVIASANGFEIGGEGYGIGEVDAYAFLGVGASSHGTEVLGLGAGNVILTGPVTVTANAKGTHVGTNTGDGDSHKFGNVFGTVEAGAFFDIEHVTHNVTIGGNVTVSADAVGSYVGVVSAYGNNDALASGSYGVEGRVEAGAGIYASDIGDLTFNDNVTVTAKAHGSHVGSVVAYGNNVSTVGGVHGDVSADGFVVLHSISTAVFKHDVAVTANASGDHVGVAWVFGSNALVGTNGGSVSGRVEADAHLYASSISALTFNGKLGVKAAARGTDVGSVYAIGSNDRIAAGSYDAHGYVRGTVSADAYIHVEDVDSAKFDGDVTATASAAGKYVGVVGVDGNYAHVATADGDYAHASASVGGHVNAQASVDLSEDSNVVAFKGDLTVTANANGSYVGTVDVNGNHAVVAGAHATADGVAHAKVRGGVDASASVDASDIGSLTFGGAVTVAADAVGKHVGVVSVTGSNAYVDVASHDGLDYRYGSASASVSGNVAAGAHVQLDGIDVVTFKGPLTATANANGSQVGSIEVKGDHANVARAFDSNGGDVFAKLRGGVDASASVEASDMGSLTFGAVTVAADAVGRHVGVASVTGSNAFVDGALDDGYAYASASHTALVSGSVAANARVNLGGIGGVTFKGPLTVTADASGNQVGNIAVYGNNAIVGGAEQIGTTSIDGHVDAFVNGFVGANAEVDAGYIDSLTFSGVDVAAGAHGSHVGSVFVNGSDARVAVAFGEGAIAAVIGDVEANALVALGTYDSGSIGAVTFKGDVDVTASANGMEVGRVGVIGNDAHIATGDGYANVDASVNGAVSAHAAVRLGSSDGEIDTVTFQKSVVVTANANGSHVGTASANGSDAYVADIYAYAYGRASVRGGVYADASIEASYVGALTFQGAVDVKASANGLDVGAVTAIGNGAHIETGGGYSDVYSSVDGDVSAHASIDAQYINTVNFRGDVAVTANANGSHVGSIEAKGNDYYIATGDGDLFGEVQADAFVGVQSASNATFNGKLNVTANANGKYVGAVTATGDGDVGYAYTEAYVEADAHVDAQYIENVTFSQVGVTAKANGSYVAEVTESGHTYIDVYGTGYVEAGADVYASEVGFLGFGPVTVKADAVGHTVGGTVDGDAYVDVENAGSVAFGHGVSVKATASGSYVRDNVEADARLFIDPNTVVVYDGITVAAHAVGNSVDGNVSASALATIEDAQLIAIFGPTRVSAVASGNSVDGVEAKAMLNANNSDGSEVFQGGFGPITVTALANVGTGGASHANALAAANLDAEGNLDIFGSGTFQAGVTVTAIADSADNARYAKAGAYIVASADGAVFIHGNVTALAEAVGTGDGVTAKAHQHIEGSNVTLVGNLRSLAFGLGSGIGDSAQAGVGVFADGAPGNILLIEKQDPIAYAEAGDPVVAFRQAHYSTEHSATGNFGTHAFADIDIEPGSPGSVIVLTPTTDQQLALMTLETLQPNPPWDSSSLSEILLSIDHHDCGVLGGAGNPNGKPVECEKGPFNISETDTLP